MTTKIVRSLAIAVSVIALGLWPGCRTGIPEGELLRMSAAEALAVGKRLMEEERYYRARAPLRHAFEVEPNSPAGREALLLLADSFFLHGGGQNLAQAEARYRDYLNRFPTSDRADYAQFQIAESLAKRMERVDRDQTTSVQAREAYEEVLRLYPASPYAEKARERIQVVDNRLAEHDMEVGRFYLRFGLPQSAATRFEYLLENHPNYPRLDRTLYYLGVARERMKQPEEAKEAFDRLAREFPDSQYVEQIPNREG